MFAIAHPYACSPDVIRNSMIFSPNPQVFNHTMINPPMCAHLECACIIITNVTSCFIPVPVLLLHP